jgi:hypothetical protein
MSANDQVVEAPRDLFRGERGRGVEEFVSRPPIIVLYEEPLLRKPRQILAVLPGNNIARRDFWETITFLTLGVCGLIAILLCLV